MTFESDLVFVQLDRVTAERLLVHIHLTENGLYGSNDIVLALENALNPKTCICGCCIRPNEADEHERVYVDPYMRTSHTKACIEQEIEWIEQHMTPGSIHRSGMTIEERIEQLKKIIG